jgi:hypothetical protein
LQISAGKDVIERMAENLASALDIAKDVGKFVVQLAGGGREGQTGLVEVLTQRGNRDVGRRGGGGSAKGGMTGCVVDGQRLGMLAMDWWVSCCASRRNAFDVLNVEMLVHLSALYSR